MIAWRICWTVPAAAPAVPRRTKARRIAAQEDEQRRRRIAVGTPCETAAARRAARFVHVARAQNTCRREGPPARHRSHARRSVCTPPLRLAESWYGESGGSEVLRCCRILSHAEASPNWTEVAIVNVANMATPPPLLPLSAASLLKRAPGEGMRGATTAAAAFNTAMVGRPLACGGKRVAREEVYTVRRPRAWKIWKRPSISRDLYPPLISC